MRRALVDGGEAALLRLEHWLGRAIVEQPPDVQQFGELTARVGERTGDVQRSASCLRGIDPEPRRTGIRVAPGKVQPRDRGLDGRSEAHAAWLEGRQQDVILVVPGRRKLR